MLFAAICYLLSVRQSTTLSHKSMRMGFFSRKNKSKNKNKGNEGGVDASDTVAPNLIPSDSVEFNKSAPDATFSNDDPTSASFSAIATDDSAATQKTTGAATMKVDYDANPTLLYKFIEYKDWEAALEHCAVAPDDARTWVIRYEDYKDSDECSECDYETKVIRWKMLPIHVAIVFNAPVRLVTAILEAYPAAIQETDDRKMAPIHLACRSLTNLNVAQYLIIKSTDALSMTDCKGRTALAILKEYRDKNAKKTDEDSKGELKNRDVLIKMIMQKMGIKETQQKEFRSLSDSVCSSKGADDDSREVSLGDDNRSATNSIETGSTSGKGSTFTDEGNSRKSSYSAGAPIVLSNSSNSQETGILKNPNAKCIAEKSLENDMQSGVYSIIPKDQAGKNYMKRNKKAKKPVNEADYDVKPSVLIKLIEKKMWKQANTRCVDYPEEASIWMCRLQKVQGDDNINKDVRWKILPIHSAIVLHSPVEVIESLVDAYPQGLRKGDDRNMLPLHMAFRLGEFNWREIMPYFHLLWRSLSY